MPTRRKKRKEAPGPFTAAGLVRFYEESDVGIKMKPHLVIIFASALTATVIVLNVLSKMNII